MSNRLWEPSKERIKNANITHYIKYLNNNYNLNLKNYHDLYEWSVENTKQFWKSIWDFVNIIHSQTYDQVVTNLDKFPPQTKWFQGARLNFAENLLRYQDDQIAILFRSELGKTETITYKELYQRVGNLARSLRHLGISVGDRVVAYMPNLIDAVIAMLAASSVGATWASCGAELGPDAAYDRLGQIEPKVMFCADAYTYKGETYNHLENVEEVSKKIPSIEKIVVVPYIEDDPNIDNLENAVMLDKFTSDDVIDNIPFEQLPFDHPQYIMFSSGTTGKPKCMVQSSGGVLINHMKELILHTDLKRSDRILYLASISWMMWNWLVSGLSVGSTIVLYEGNPLYPTWSELWEFIDEYNISVFGCSASYIHYLKNIDANPGKKFKLESLKQISQTGSPLSKEGFKYVYDKIKQDLHLNSISGGTDINGCFAAGSPTLPVYAGQLQARALGMEVKAYDYDGNEVYDEQAELVCETPSPSMPIYFWDDENNKKYKEAYFNYFDQHVWRHGDYIEIFDDTGGVTFYGRSDSVLKPSGVRIGTAEIYNVVEHLDEIEDSLAIGKQKEEEQEVILFVKLQNDLELTDDLKSKINSELREKASPRHVPSKIIRAPDVPYTFSGKKVESAVTNILNGRKVTNRGAMENPECLDFYQEIANNLS